MTNTLPPDWNVHEDLWIRYGIRINRIQRGGIHAGMPRRWGLLKLYEPEILFVDWHYQYHQPQTGFLASPWGPDSVMVFEVRHPDAVECARDALWRHLESLYYIYDCLEQNIKSGACVAPPRSEML